MAIVAEPSGVALTSAGLRSRAKRFRDILRIGALAALYVLQWRFATIIVTAAVAAFGPAALAGVWRNDRGCSGSRRLPRR